MNNEQEKQLEKQAEKAYHTAKAMGLPAMKAYNKFHQAVDQSKKIFQEQFEAEHGTKPCDD